ncbi:predicted membrane-associated [Helicobacter fennelliae MRY12-0050]|uniref:Predicted membrane-associated n=1 Tax=Helicobacter fennelliae MRY12-0050 TaxID=1325130 RepID=T1CTI4_9HELI|nr:predicted membrane-associated [Helicobacter fennelliae MRY12-0050]
MGNTLHIYAPIEYKEEGLVDVSGYVIGIVGVVGRNAIIKGVKFASELQGNRYVRRENRESQGIARESLNNKEAREWYVNTQLPKIKELGDKIITLEERARFHFNFRNQARKDTRDAMKDRKKAEELENDRKNKTWEEWIEYVKKRKGLTKMEDIYNYTIEASQRTNPDVNSKFGIKPQ